MKQILIITYEFPPFIGGAGSYASDLAVGLAKTNIKVDIITYNQLHGIEAIISKFKEKYDISFFTVKPIKWLHFIQFILLIKQILNRNTYDSIILNDARAKKSFAFFYPFLKKYYSKSVSIIHGNELNQFFKTPRWTIKLLGINKSMFKLYQKQKAIVTVSKVEYDNWIQHFPKFRSKIFMVNSGINTDIFYKRSENEIISLKNQLNIPNSKTIILSASRLTKPKGQDNVIKAFHELLKTEKNTLLIICGDGEYANDLKQMVNQLNLDNDVIFTGSIDRNSLSDYYAITDIFVLVSRYHEAFGLVYIEALACGCVTISGHLGGVKDIVKDKETGFIVNSEDYEELLKKLRYIIKNPCVTDKIKKQAFSFYENNFTCEIMAKKILEIIDI